MLNSDWIADAVDVLANGATNSHTGTKNASSRPVRETIDSMNTRDGSSPAPTVYSGRGRPRKTDIVPSRVRLEGDATLRQRDSETQGVGAESGALSSKPTKETETIRESASKITARDQNNNDSIRRTDVAGGPYSPESGSQPKTVTGTTPANAPTRDHTRIENHKAGVASGGTIDLIIEQHRRRWDMIRGRQRLELQGQAVCRRLSGGDKEEAGKLWREVLKDEEHSLRSWLGPFILAMEPLKAAQAEIEKALAKAVKTLPIYPWASEIHGLGDVSLSAIVGEAGTAPGDYKSVAALWKRMGVAVIGDGRQRKIAGDAAIEHGYNPERRCILWNIGQSIIKKQVRKDPDDEEKRIALGEYGQVYLDRKAYEAERVESKAHAHKRAQRYMEKRLLRDLYAAWRAADPEAYPEAQQSA